MRSQTAPTFQLAATQSADYLHFVRRLNRSGQIPDLFSFHEDLDVLPNRILLVDDKEIHTGIERLAQVVRRFTSHSSR